MGSLIDFKEISESFKYLLDKLEKFGFYLVNPKGSEKEAIESIIRTIEASDIEPIKKAAMIRESRSIIRKYKNKNDIYKIALEELSKMPEQVSVDNIEKVDDEWLSRFSENAQHVSNEEVQIIWGKILAEEMRDPNTIPKSLIHSLSITDRHQAELFSILCAHTVHLENNKIYTYCDYERNKQYWIDLGLNFTELMNLQEIGLITYNPLKYYSTYNKVTNNVIINLGNSQKYVLNKPLGFNNIPYGDILFSNSGLALCKALHLPSNEIQIKHIVEGLQQDQFTVTPI